MPAFAIVETRVAAYPTLVEARQAMAAAEGEPRLVVSSEAELAASPLSLGQLVQIWNSFAGLVPFEDLKPVRKFENRQVAVRRIWRAIGRLEPVSSADAQPCSKKAQIIQLLRRPEGATLQQLVEATGWQPHSVRGFLSGTLAKKLGLKITRAKRDDGAGVYLLTE